MNKKRTTAATPAVQDKKNSKCAPQKRGPAPQEFISLRGARQHNLKNLSFDIPLNAMTVITGLSGSGKSSLAFDTIYAEGQRRYVETFSSYARQFLDRMDRPQIDAIAGIPPAIAINQTNPVRTSRSTVGTMTELNDHLKLLFSRVAALYCPSCGEMVVEDSPESIFSKLLALQQEDATLRELLITFPVVVPENFSRDEVVAHLTAGGYTRLRFDEAAAITVVLDRVALKKENKSRIVEDCETALKHGRGVVTISRADETKGQQASLRFSSGLHCAPCDIGFNNATANHFSFNSPLGACETCRGFGRVIGIDAALVVPDVSKTLRDGAIRPFQSPSYQECQDDLLRFARKRGIPVDRSWNKLTGRERTWVFAGDGEWDAGVWYGVNRFFTWLESRSYKMHVRVQLARYRTYRLCEACNGSRLKPEAGYWRIGTGNGTTLFDVMQMPLETCALFFDELELPKPYDEAAVIVLDEIRTRLRYLIEVGLGYLTLDRQSRTLSGGEVQRINLTTALGTSLVNTLFVLDEPSVGLHARDIGRLIGILHRLRDAGNTLVVVEHDPELIKAADRVLDMGPGPGAQGGNIVFYGTMPEFYRSKESLTAAYVTGRKVHVSKRSCVQKKRGDVLAVFGATEHNLKNIDVSIPLHQLVGIAGVSGSGKSTLIEDILYCGLQRILGKPVATPGAHRCITGYEQIEDVVLVDQSALGKTTRSNPVSYVGAFGPIRNLFAAADLSRKRMYRAATFSFNTGTGRCPSCNGAGFEQVEMQFLSDVYLRCGECNGLRYRREVREVKVAGQALVAAGPTDRSIDEVLALTIEDACTFFAGYPKILKLLEPLLAVGLSYLQLGQPLPTLSGGEAQRLKLASFLAASGAADRKGILFLFDEPTTGLHFADIAVLLAAFERLITAGHSVVVIEHNLDVLAYVDHIIELGPEGGEKGGYGLFTGTPAACMQQATHTGYALRTYAGEKLTLREKGVGAYGIKHASPPMSTSIVIKNAREHNLKTIDVTIPHNAFTVITGVSGSGKSTVAFDILFAEGQRRYLESLNAYARQFVQPATRPDVDLVTGVPPTVAIEQRTSRGGRKSTVATVTEIYHYLRLLYVTIGKYVCPTCNIPVAAQAPAAILDTLRAGGKNRLLHFYAPLVMGRKGTYADLAMWAVARGYAKMRIDGTVVSVNKWPKLDRYREHTIELFVAEHQMRSTTDAELEKTIGTTIELGKGHLQVDIISKRGVVTQEVFSVHASCPGCRRSFPELDPRLFSFNSKHGWCSSCFGTGLAMTGFDAEQTGEETIWNRWWSGEEKVCSVCHGKRLSPDALAVHVANKSIDVFTALSVDAARLSFAALAFTGREAVIAVDILAAIGSRLGFLQEVGLGYLTLDRAAPTLSGGEAQRIRLASQLGSQLRGVCYVLDEPTIGLHSRDNQRLISTLRALCNQGNTIVVVEHDEATMQQADYLIDLGPAGGSRGGEVLAQGSVATVMKSKKSITARYLNKKRTIPRQPRSVASASWLQLAGVTHHNLKKITASLPLGRLVAVTGVSGSGKSTLVRDVLYANVASLLAEPSRKRRTYEGCTAITGWEPVDRILEVDQTPIGKTPRSCPATYVGFWDDIRKCFAQTPEAQIRGYGASRFSFNTDEGRCSACAGQGVKKIEMSFLPDVTVPCEVCNGKRFTEETLSVTFKEKQVGEVLMMSIDDAVPFFAAHPKIHRAVKLLQDVGLGYLTLGQQSPTLSGGEAQRIKLVAELSKAMPLMRKRREGASRSKTNHTLYVLDEPTVGLHRADIDKLLLVLHRLVDAGNTVVVIEHNLDVVAEADWVLDLGPEGGDAGGEIVAEGAPFNLAVAKGRVSYTNSYLRDAFGGAG